MPGKYKDDIKFWLTILTVAILPAVISFVTTKFQVNMNTKAIAVIETKMDVLGTMQTDIAVIKGAVQFLKEQK